MSELENRAGSVRYDSWPTEELQEILRKHAHGELETEPDTEELYCIMEVLANRRQQESPNAFRSNEEAFAEFREFYMPKEDEATSRPAVRQFPARWMKATAAVLAVVLVLAAGVTVSAEAFGVDIWDKFACWTNEIFHFTDAGTPSEGTTPAQEHNLELRSLEDALAQYEITEKVAPRWLPDGYTCENLLVKESPKEISLHAVYKNNDTELIISIRQTIGIEANQIEKSEDLIEIYTVNGLDYYLFSNNSTLQAAWVIGEFECIIGGKITLEELKAMIDSI